MPELPISLSLREYCQIFKKTSTPQECVVADTTNHLINCEQVFRGLVHHVTSAHTDTNTSTTDPTWTCDENHVCRKDNDVSTHFISSLKLLNFKIFSSFEIKSVFFSVSSGNVWTAIYYPLNMSRRTLPASTIQWLKGVWFRLAWSRYFCVKLWF